MSTDGREQKVADAAALLERDLELGIFRTS